MKLLASQLVVFLCNVALALAVDLSCDTGVLESGITYDVRGDLNCNGALLSVAQGKTTVNVVWGALYSIQITVPTGGAINFTGGGLVMRKSNAGAIIVNGEATFESEATFEENTAPNAAGGALKVDGGLATFNRSAHFSKNTASMGGACQCTDNGKIVFLQDSSFNENYAQKGGSLYATNGGQITFVGVSNFNNGRADVDGGAIWNDINCLIELKSGGPTEFSNNVASNGHGGGIYNSGTIFLAGGAGFDQNQALFGGGIYNLIGGTVVFGAAGRFDRNVAQQAAAIQNAGQVYFCKLSGGQSYVINDWIGVDVTQPQLAGDYKCDTSSVNIPTGITPQPTVPQTLTTMPTPTPSNPPTALTEAPTMIQTPAPPITVVPTPAATTLLPTPFPTLIPTQTPTSQPTDPPLLTTMPTVMPTAVPSAMPTVLAATVPPTVQLTLQPTIEPTAMPSAMPTVPATTLQPTIQPSATIVLTLAPTNNPTLAVPTLYPTHVTVLPTIVTVAPVTAEPSLAPTVSVTTVESTVVPTEATLPVVSVSPTADPSTLTQQPTAGSTPAASAGANDILSISPLSPSTPSLYPWIIVGSKSITRTGSSLAYDTATSSIIVTGGMYTAQGQTGSVGRRKLAATETAFVSTINQSTGSTAVYSVGDAVPYSSYGLCTAASVVSPNSAILGGVVDSADGTTDLAVWKVSLDNTAAPIIWTLPSGGDDYVLAIAVSSSDHVYIGGSTTGGLTATATLTPSSDGKTRYFVAKLEPLNGQGDADWIVQGDDEGSSITGIAFNEATNVVAVTVDNDSSNIPLGTLLPISSFVLSGGSSSSSILLLDGVNGGIISEVAIEGSSTSVAFDGVGDVISAGCTDEGLISILKHDGSTTAELWSYSDLYSRDGCVYSIAVDSNNNIVAAGASVVYSAADGTPNLDAFVLIIDGANGHELCYHQIGSDNNRNDAALAVTVDPLNPSLITVSISSEGSLAGSAGDIGAPSVILISIDTSVPSICTTMPIGDSDGMSYSDAQTLGNVVVGLVISSYFVAVGATEASASRQLPSTPIALFLVWHVQMLGSMAAIGQTAEFESLKGFTSSLRVMMLSWSTATSAVPASCAHEDNPAYTQLLGNAILVFVLLMAILLVHLASVVWLTARKSTAPSKTFAASDLKDYYSQGEAVGEPRANYREETPSFQYSSARDLTLTPIGEPPAHEAVYGALKSYLMSLGSTSGKKASTSEEKFEQGFTPNDTPQPIQNSISKHDWSVSSMMRAPASTIPAPVSQYPGALESNRSSNSTGGRVPNPSRTGAKKAVIGDGRVPRFLLFPHVELVFLLFAVGGSTYAQSSAIGGDCGALKGLAAFLLLAFPILFLIFICKLVHASCVNVPNSRRVYVAIQTNVLNTSVTISILRSLVDSFTNWSRGVSIFQFGDRGMWLKDKRRAVQAVQHGFFLLIGPFTVRGSAYNIFALSKLIILAMIGGLVTDTSAVIGTFLAFCCTDCVVLLFMKPYNNRVVQWFAILSAVVSVVSFSLMLNASLSDAVTTMDAGIILETVFIACISLVVIIDCGMILGYFIVNKITCTPHEDGAGTSVERGDDKSTPYMNTMHQTKWTALIMNTLKSWKDAIMFALFPSIVEKARSGRISVWKKSTKTPLTTRSFTHIT